MRCLALLTLGCFGVTGCWSAPARTAVLVKSACSATLAAPASAGLEVRAGRRHSDARTISVTNVSGVAHEVHVVALSRLEGPCSGDYTRSTDLQFSDQATGAPPATVELQPGQHLELQIGQQAALASSSCVKLGIAVQLVVDDAKVCAEAGVWIASSDGDE